jgi:uncharacterized protein with von Willebrand factor type A (vWA) domain
MKDGPHVRIHDGEGTRPDGVPQGLAASVLAFADFLRGTGFRVFPTRIHDALKGLAGIDLGRRSDVEEVLRTTLVSNEDEWRRFPGLFHAFWYREDPEDETDRQPPPFPAPVRGPRSESRQSGEAPSNVLEEADGEADTECAEESMYSAVARMNNKDLGELDSNRLHTAQRALRQIARSFPLEPFRRKKRSRRPADLDLPQTLKKSIQTGGWPFKLHYRKHKRKLKRFVILADVSGSMDRYTRLVVPFLLGLRGMHSRAEVFVFSTSLASITELVRHLPPEEALNRLAGAFPAWSGGTRIGLSLRQFRRSESGRAVSRRTVVLILSDGWDLGDPEILRDEMAELSRRAHKILWLNPFAGDPNFEPTCKGMRAALPHVDALLPAGDLEGLHRVAALISDMMADGPRAWPALQRG